MSSNKSPIRKYRIKITDQLHRQKTIMKRKLNKTLTMTPICLTNKIKCHSLVYFSFDLSNLTHVVAYKILRYIVRDLDNWEETCYYRYGSLINVILLINYFILFYNLYWLLDSRNIKLCLQNAIGFMKFY